MLTATLRIYARTFLSQTVGIIGLLWCLFDDHQGFGIALALLVLVDQSVFLAGRFGRTLDKNALTVGLDLWCLWVGLFDITLLFALLLRGSALREPGTGALAADSWNALALSLATFLHLHTDLAPGDSATRFLLIFEAMIGAAALLGFAVALVGALWARLSFSRRL